MPLSLPQPILPKASQNSPKHRLNPSAPWTLSMTPIVQGDKAATPLVWIRCSSGSHPAPLQPNFLPHSRRCRDSEPSMHLTVPGCRQRYGIPFPSFSALEMSSPHQSPARTSSTRLSTSLGTLHASWRHVTVVRQ